MPDNPVFSLQCTTQLQMDCLKEALVDYLADGSPDDDWYHAVRDLVSQFDPQE